MAKMRGLLEQTFAALGIYLGDGVMLAELRDISAYMTEMLHIQESLFAGSISDRLMHKDDIATAQSKVDIVFMRCCNIIL
jgi:hypothetical protein